MSTWVYTNMTSGDPWLTSDDPKNTFQNLSLKLIIPSSSTKVHGHTTHYTNNINQKRQKEQNYANKVCKWAILFACFVWKPNEICRLSIPITKPNHIAIHFITSCKKWAQVHNWTQKEQNMQIISNLICIFCNKNGIEKVSMTDCLPSSHQLTSLYTLPVLKNEPWQAVIYSKILTNYRPIIYINHVALYDLKIPRKNH